MDENATQEPALIPLALAARRMRVSRATIYRWAKEGRFSVTLAGDGQKLADIAELARVFPEIASKHLKQDAKRQSQDHENMDEKGADVLLQAELHATKETLRLTQAQLAEAKEREHRLMGIVENQTRLLEYKAQAEAPTPPPAPAGIAPWLGWLTIAAMFGVMGMLIYLR